MCALTMPLMGLQLNWFATSLVKLLANGVDDVVLVCADSDRLDMGSGGLSFSIVACG